MTILKRLAYRFLTYLLRRLGEDPAIPCWDDDQPQKPLSEMEQFELREGW